MITREADYAIRTILYLAQNSKNSRQSPASVNLIAEKMEIPYRFLRRISRALQNYGLIECHRGKDGGMILTKELADISLAEVINIVNPQSIKLNLCLLNEDNCTRKSYCKVHFAMERLQKKLDDELNSITFDQLI
ncbi:MAG: Rrf2 family transcriptional regulator [Victivallaceae bacterium]|nr:Rrf2 family transcriptional regulator [Victivallaceae bacterium]